MADRLFGVNLDGSLPNPPPISTDDARTIVQEEVVDELRLGGVTYRYINLKKAEPRLSALPRSLKILAESVLRASTAGPEPFLAWMRGGGRTERELEFHPARVLMHDTTCVPALVDIAAMRDALAQLGGDPRRLNPEIPVDLVVDHSVMVDSSGAAPSFAFNLRREFERNSERYAFIRWAQNNLANFRVVPPGNGIVHQINLEHLSEVVRVAPGPGLPWLVPDTLVGTDSHTPMINALGILAWGVGGIEGLAAAMGRPLALRLPEVIGVRLVGSLRHGVTATDLALTLTELFRQVGVVEKFIEFYGPGLASLAVADRATVANMAPEYGATCSFFPTDERTIDYLRLVGRTEELLARVRSYAQAQGLWGGAPAGTVFSEKLEFDLSSVEATLAGPRRPHERMALDRLPGSFLEALPDLAADGSVLPRAVAVPGERYKLHDGDLLIAAITSCTNTSNPALMIGAGLLARKARAAGLTVPPWVKTSLSPGSKVVTDYLQLAGLQDDLDALGFNLTGYGCMTCIGNSGALVESVAQLAQEGAIVGAAILSGNRNFEGRINPGVRAAYLASPPLVVAYALAGTVLVDLRRDPVGSNRDGQPVYLEQLWPSDEEIQEILARVVTPKVFRARVDDVFHESSEWRGLDGAGGVRFAWKADSTYLRCPPYFDGLSREFAGFPAITGARALLVLGDNITTDHISPAGAIPPESLAGAYLSKHGVLPAEFNQYSTRRGNHEVMLRGIFSNPGLENELLGPAGMRGGYARVWPSGEILPVYAAGLRYRAAAVPLLIFAGENYGAGSSRDWAAKGPALLGVRAVIAESFERIHRSNLIGMGILPLQYTARATRGALALDGTETFDIPDLAGELGPRQSVRLVIHRADRPDRQIDLRLCVETMLEAEQLRHGGLMKHMLRSLL